MLFNSLDYLIFLTVALAGYWALHRMRAGRLVLVLVLSSLFYATSSPWYLGLIFFSTLVDWFVAKKIGAHELEADRKRWLAVSVVVNLSLLGFFKYHGTDLMADWLHAGGHDDVAIGRWTLRAADLRNVLPVGISFYTFESLSYCIDVYRRKTEPAKTPLDLLFFITFFPKLVAGPIARPAELLPQIKGEPKLSREGVTDGVFLIVTGLVKKVVFADFVSTNLVDRVFETPEAYTAVEVVVALYGFTLQMYADFSGYTDIARGSAKLFAIELPENFDRPYQAANPAEFWRRWHMTLSTWLRDYLYFPLGGSQLGEARTYLNLWLTIFLIGLWHGGTWNFVIYGAIQGTAVALHRYVSKRTGHDPARDSRALRALKVFGTLQFVVFSRILFRGTDLDNASDIVRQLFSGTTSTANVAPAVWAVLFIGFAAHYTPRDWFAQIRQFFSGLPAPAQGAVSVAIIAALMAVAAGQTVPYIYFQF